jgi:predicted CXXCH cytochrome family protein
MHRSRHFWQGVLVLSGITGLFLMLILLDMPGAAAKDAKPAPKATYVGSETCVGCHEAAIQEHVKGTAHGAILSALEAKGKGYLCEGCHGPGSRHMEDPGPESGGVLKATAQSGATCAECHKTRLSPARWRASDHRKAGVGCTQCHARPESGQPLTGSQAGAAGAKLAAAPQPHDVFNRAPSSELCMSCHGALRGELAMPSHHPIKEGIVACVDCHDPHAPMTQKVKREVCVRCHAKTHGPYIYEHVKAKGLTDGCLDCHRPHGSPNARLLKISGRGLCLQCHADRATHFPGRDCVSCHMAVHGSNSNRLLFAE